MRLYMLYDQGTEKSPEDGIVFSLPFIGVTDGLSGVYLPQEGPTLFSGRSGGRMVSDIIAETFLLARWSGFCIEEILTRANQRIKEIQTDYGFDLSETDRLSGASFAIAKLDRQVEIITTGDCFAVVQKKSGEIMATKNQAFSHVMENLLTIAELMAKHGDRNKMWQEFGPILAQRRLRDVNKKTEKGFGLLNGQPTFEEFWQRIVVLREEVNLLLPFTDGLIYYPDSGEKELFVEKVLALYQLGGLKRILEDTRRREEAKKETSHIDYPEATAIAIELNSHG